MYIGVRTLKRFDLFTSPNIHVINGYYDYISNSCLQDSKYVDYIVLSYKKNILKPFIIDYDEVDKFLKNGYRVIAYNRIDYIIMEVRYEKR